MYSNESILFLYLGKANSISGIMPMPGTKNIELDIPPKYKYAQ